MSAIKVTYWSPSDPLIVARGNWIIRGQIRVTSGVFWQIFHTIRILISNVTREKQAEQIFSDRQTGLQ